MISRWIISVVLLFGILLLMLPNTDEESLAKIASASMLMCTVDFREQVAEKVVGAEAVAIEFQNKCPDLIADLEVDERGAMVITGSKHQLKMSLTPLFEAGAGRWSCRGAPAAAVTKLCKP